MNVEVAHGLTEQDEHEEHESASPGWVKTLEIIEVFVLAIVAIATAWSGYQATKWDGQQSLLYGHSSRDRFQADAASTFGGQLLSADASMFTAWLQAHSTNDTTLESLYVRRFSPDYRVAFNAWLATDPFTNPKAPAGPGLMPPVPQSVFREGCQPERSGIGHLRRGVICVERPATSTCETRSSSPPCCSWWRSPSASRSTPPAQA